MKALEDRIFKEGKVLSADVLKVGSFLNQQLDPVLMDEMGAEIFRLFQDCGVTKILTIEASGIALALAAAYHFHVPAVFAKKGKSSNVEGNQVTTSVFSFTRGTTYEVSVSSEYICENDTVLVVDDFLASGNALIGLIDLVKKTGAKLAGAAIAIEKGFQNGGKELRESGIRLESLAIIDEMSQDGIVFRKQA